MRFILIVAVLLAVSAYTSAKQFTKCEVGQALFDAQISRAEIPRIVCAAEKGTGLETNTKGVRNGLNVFGIFQFNSLLSCEDDTKINLVPPVNKCNMKCSELLDDNLKDDAKCMFWSSYYNTLADWGFWSSDECASKGQSYLGDDCELTQIDIDETI